LIAMTKVTQLTTTTKGIIFFLVIIMLFSTCKDPYSLTTIGISGNLIIDGAITSEPGPYHLSLGTTNGVGNTPIPAPGATITAFDDRGNQELYKDLGKGVYELSGKKIIGTPGNKYYLDIVMPSGQHYQSTQEVLPAHRATDIGAFQFETITVTSSEGVPVKNNVIKILLNSTLPTATSNSFFRWSVDELYRFFPTCFPNPFNTCPLPCYIPVPVTNSNLTLVATNDFSGTSLSNIVLLTRDLDETFLDMHYFNINQYSMNEGANDYWDKVKQLVSHTGSIFDTPVANLTGNIHNVNNPSEVVYGYFEASLLTVTHIGVPRGAVPGELPDPCKYFQGNASNSGSRYPKVCLNCLSAAGSTRTQPAWFIP